MSLSEEETNSQTEELTRLIWIWALITCSTYGVYLFHFILYATTSSKLILWFGLTYVAYWLTINVFMTCSWNVYMSTYPWTCVKQVKSRINSALDYLRVPLFQTLPDLLRISIWRISLLTSWPLEARCSIYMFQSWKIALNENISIWKCYMVYVNVICPGQISP